MKIGKEKNCTAPALNGATRRIAYGLTIAVACGFSPMTDEAAERSLASVSKLDLSAIVVDGESTSLDAAYCFRVWSGPRPDYPPSEDANLANLRAYLQRQGDVAHLSHLDWIVDFVIRFDCDVAAGDVALYGQLDPLFPDWVNFNEISSIPALKANEEFRLLNVDFITYGMALEMIENFNCGVSSRLYDTTITVDLKLYDPSGAADPLTIATCSHSFVRTHRGNWFDAHIADYFFWPMDAALAFGGSWRASEPLSLVASVAKPGELEVDTDDGLAFVADEAKDVGSAPVETVLETDVLMDEWAVTALPPADSAYKGGVLLAGDGQSRWFYGLAKVGEKNEWVRLDGPTVETDGETVHLKMTSRKIAGDVVVKYEIGGVEYKYSGHAEIPVAADGVVKNVGFIGSGTVYSLFASALRTKQGLLLYLK